MDPTQYQQAIKDIESSGGNYGALGPVTDSGDRAYGAYQVMGNNIPDWTEKHYGSRLTPQQFLQNKEAQDAVFNGEFGSYLNKYGNHNDAASMWFSGRPMAKAGNSSDGYNTVPQYVAKFNAALQGRGALSPTAAALSNARAEDTGDGEDESGTESTPAGVLNTIIPGNKNAGGTKLDTIAEGLTQVGASLAGISKPAQAYALAQQLAAMKKDRETKYQMHIDKNGNVYRINPDDGSVSMFAPPAAAGGNLPQYSTPWGDSSKLTDPNDPKQVEAYLSTMNPQQRATVEGLLMNTIPPPNARDFKGKDSPWPAAFASAKLIDKGVDPVAYAGRQAGYREAATKVAESARAINQGVEHQGDVLLDTMKNLGNGSVPLLNSGKNWMSTQLGGHAEQNNFKTTVHGAVDELSKIFKGAGISDTEIRKWEENLPDNMSPEMQRGQMKILSKLMSGSFDALEQKRRLEVGNYAASRMEPIMGEKAKAALKRIEDFADSGPNGFNIKSGGGNKQPNQADLFKFLPIGQ